MIQEFIKSWVRSKQRRKQRKYRFNAPLHTKQKFMKVHLSKELKEKHKMRSIGIRRKDKVIVSRGQHKGKVGKVERVSVKMTKVFVSGIETLKKEGSKTLIPLDPSNLIITELYTEDKKRKIK